MQNLNKKFAIILFSRYFNLLVEYIVLLLTSSFLGAEVRGDFVITISTIITLSTIGGFSFEQYGGVLGRSKSMSFNYDLFFNCILYFSLFLSCVGVLFASFILNLNFFISFLIGLSVVSTVYCRQSIVEFQLTGKIFTFSVTLIFGRFLYLVFIFLALEFTENLSFLIFCYLLANLIQCLSISLSSRAKGLLIWLNRRDLEEFMRLIKDYYLVHLITVMTGLYAFVDLYLVYKNLGSSKLAIYNLAMQLNAAIAVCGQGYNVYVYSSQSTSQLGAVLKNIPRINLFIIALSVVVFSLTYTPVFGYAIDYVLGKDYKDLLPTLKFSILLLPFSLISMFYAPIWIITKRFRFLLAVSMINLVLFTLIAIYLMDYGLMGIFGAQGISGIFSMIINLSHYFWLKRRGLYGS